METGKFLEKIIQKAIKGGFDKSCRYNWDKSRVETDESVWDGISIIFDLDFAKAFWGTDNKYRSVKGNMYYCEHCPNIVAKCPNCKKRNTNGKMLELWKWHLQQMVLEKYPLTYMQKFLE